MCTAPYLRTVLELRFAADSDATVAVRTNNRTIHTFSVKAAGGVTLQSAVIDITDDTEAARETAIAIDIALAREGDLYVFEEHNELASVLRQESRLRYTSLSLLYFLAIALLLPAAVLILAGFFSRAQTTYRGLGAGLVAIIALYHLAGGPDLPGIAPRKRTRRLFAKIRRVRPIAVLVLIAITAPAVWYAAGIVGTLYRRQMYTRAIDQAVLGDDPVPAFLLFPWRREGQILIERQVYLFRTRNNAMLQTHLQTLVMDPRVERAARSPEASFYRDVPRHSGVTTDPLIWYVNLLLESKLRGAPIKALDALKGRSGDEADVRRELIHLQITKGKPYEAAVARLESLLESPRDGTFKRSFLYQYGWDTLGAVAVSKATQLAKSCQTPCEDATRAAIRAELDNAVARFHLVLHARAEAVQSDQPRWLRPPQKLYTYHLLHPLPNVSAQGAADAKRIADAYAYCACLLESVAWRDCDYEQLQKALKSAEFDVASKFIAGTVLDKKILEDVTTTLNKGWRF